MQRNPKALNLNQFLLLAVAALGIYVVVDGRPVHRAKEIVYSGSVAGVEACTEVRKSELLALEAVRTFCARKHQRSIRLSEAQLSGRAIIETQAISGSITNGSNGLVISEIELEAFILDSDGNETSHRAATETWVGPGEEIEFRAEFEERDIADLPETWCSRFEEGEKAVDCKSWGVRSAKGVRLD